MKNTFTKMPPFKHVLKKSMILSAIPIFACFAGHAQITTTISGGSTANGSYASLASAVTALNVATISGPVTVNLTAGQTEALTGVIKLTNSGTSNAAVTFQKNGAGNNPKLTAYTGSALTDAMFVLEGSDYITIDGLDLDNNTAIDVNAAMEYGYFLARADANNGCQHITIKNCNIILDASKSSTAIHTRNSTYAAQGTAIQPLSFAGTNSLITIKSNSTFSTNGITFVAFTPSDISSALPYGTRDSGNVVGGPLLADGNSVVYGTPALITACNGIQEVWNYSFTVQNNYVGNYSAAISNSSAASGNRAIFLNQSSPGASALVKDNVIKLRSSSTVATTALSNTNCLTGIMCEMGYNYAAGGKISITGNSVSLDVTTTTNAVPYAPVVYDSKVDTLEISGNEITGYTGGGTTGRLIYGVNTFGTAPTTATTNSYLSIKRNNIHDLTMSTTGILNLIGTNASYASFSLDSNNISNITRTAGGLNTGNNYMIYVNNSFANGTANITGNNISNITLSTGCLIGIYYGTGTGASPLYTIKGNVLNQFATAGVSSTYGIQINATSNALANSSIYDNTFSNFTGGTGGGATTSDNMFVIFNNGICPNLKIYNNSIINITGGNNHTLGIYHVGTNTNISIYNNSILNLNGTSINTFNVSGIYCQGSPSNSLNTYIYNNKIAGCHMNNPTSGINSSAYGIFTGNNTNLNYYIYNNHISDITSPAYNGVVATPYGVNGIALGGGAGTKFYVSNNTIFPGSDNFLGTTNPSGNFGAQGILYSRTSALNDIRNNIINIQGTASGNGTIAAVRCATSGTADIGPVNLTLKNNILYVNDDPKNWLYVEGYGVTGTAEIKNGYAAALVADNVSTNLKLDAGFNMPCGLFSTFMNGFAANNFTENNMNLSGGLFAPTGSSFAENGGTVLTTPSITTDILGDNRGATPDMGAKEFTGTATDQSGPGISFIDIPNQNCLNAPTLIAVITDQTGINNTTNKPRLYYKYASDPTDISAWKFVEGNNTNGNAYTFLMNYSLLPGTVNPDSAIQYFIAAQDINAYTSVYPVITASGFCPASVALAAGAFPVTGFKSFVVKQPSSLDVTATATLVCPGIADTLTALVTRVDLSNPTGAFVSTATSTAVSPFNYHATNGRRIQQIYTAADLRATGLRAGNINGMTIYATSVTAGTPAVMLNIKIGNITGNALAPSSTATAFSAVPTTTVFSAPYIPVAGSNAFNFSTPFYWDGSSNIMVEFCHAASGGSTLAAPSFYFVQNAGLYNVLNISDAAACNTVANGSTLFSRIIASFKGVVDVSNAYPAYTWNDGTTNTGASADTLIIQPPFPTGNVMTYTATVTDPSGCSMNDNIVINKAVNPISFNATPNPSNSCGGTATALNAGVNATWTPANGLFTDAGATNAYSNTALQNIYARLNNNRYVTATYNNGTCTFTDSLLVMVPTITGAVSVSASGYTDSAYINGATDIRTNNCELLATVIPSGGNQVTGMVKAKVTLDGSVQTVGTSPYLTRHFEITPMTNGAAATAQLKLYFTQSEFDAYNSFVTSQGTSAIYPLLPANPAQTALSVNMKISKYEGAGATPVNNTGVAVISNPTLNWNTGTNLWELSFPVAGFSTFYIHTNLSGTPLPVGFAAFDAIAQQETNHLTWSTGDVKAAGKFDILHSNDGMTFEPIGEQATNTRNNYAFNHNAPKALEVYQLKYTDANGKVYYSTIQMVQRTDKHQLAVMLYPNPIAQGNMNVNVMNANASLLVYSITDVLGKEVLKGNIPTFQNNANTTIDVSSLPNGIYNFKLLSDNDKVVKRLVVSGK